MKKILVSIVAIMAVLVCFSSAALPWGSATHVYIADRIGKKLGLKNQKEMYGAMAPDLFNYLFGYEFQPYLEDQAHGTPGDESFMKVWKSVCWRPQKFDAYGFVSHNDVWGADYTAHWQALTLESPYKPQFIPPGYVMIKAAQLMEILQDPLDEVFGDLPLGRKKQWLLRLEMCHHLLEAAGDIFIAGVKPQIGFKMTSCALLRSPGFPLLLVSAYAQDFAAHTGLTYEQAAGVIISAEKEFRKTVILQGQVLMQDQATAVTLTAEQLAGMVVSYLGGLGIQLPPEIIPLLEDIVEGGLMAAMGLLTDYMTEIEATIEFVAGQLAAHGVSY